VEQNHQGGQNAPGTAAPEEEEDAREEGTELLNVT